MQCVLGHRSVAAIKGLLIRVRKRHQQRSRDRVSCPLSHEQIRDIVTYYSSCMAPLKLFPSWEMDCDFSWRHKWTWGGLCVQIDLHVHSHTITYAYKHTKTQKQTWMYIKIEKWIYVENILHLLYRNWTVEWDCEYVTCVDMVVRWPKVICLCSFILNGPCDPWGLLSATCIRHQCSLSGWETSTVRDGKDLQKREKTGSRVADRWGERTGQEEKYRWCRGKTK